MFLLEITFIKSKAEVEPYLEAHAAWGEQRFIAGDFLMAGAKWDEKGGVVITKGMSEEQLSSLLADDPFVQASVANYRITGFNCRFAQPELSVLMEL